MLAVNNPSRGITIPRDKGKVPKKLEEPYNEQEISTLLDALNGSRHYLLVLFLCHTGCRVGEASGLNWSDLDLDNRKATIQRNIVRNQVINSPKSDKNRKIDLTRHLVAELRKLKLQNQRTGTWVFQNQAGGYVDMDNFRRREWYPTIEKHELRRTRPHDLRHSYASLLI